MSGIRLTASKPEFGRPCRSAYRPRSTLDTGILRDLTHRDWMALPTISIPTFWSLLAGLRPGHLARKSSATPPPATTPSSTAALVAHGVVDAILAPFTNPSAAADADDRYTTGELSQTL
jgi:hypothetical protein